MKKDREKLEREACTFHPKIIGYKKPPPPPPKPTEGDQKQDQDTVNEKSKRPRRTNMSTCEPTPDRCKMLYNLSKRITKHDDKPTDLYKFEKERREYTFAPNLHKEESKNITIQAGAVDETIERMKQARMERERVSRALARCQDNAGMRFELDRTKFHGNFEQFQGVRGSEVQRGRSKDKPSGQKQPEARVGQAPFSTEISPQSTKVLAEVLEEKSSSIKPSATAPAPGEEVRKEIEEIPQPPAGLTPPKEQSALSSSVGPDSKEALLFIDVNLGQQQKRIVVYKGDTAEALAESFARENGSPNLCERDRTGRDREVQARGADQHAD